MRILSVSNTPLVASGGSGYVILEYAKRLRERGHRVDLIGPADYELYHGARRGIRYRQALGMGIRIPQRLRTAGYDVVETYGAEAWLAHWRLTRRAGRRFLTVAHSNGIETHALECERSLAQTRPRYQLDLSRPFAAGFRAVDAIVTVSEWERDFAIHRGYRPHDRVLAIENPLPDEYLGQQISHERPQIIGFAGSWIPRKGTGFLPASMADVLRAAPGWTLALVGVGTDFRSADWFPADVVGRVDVVPFLNRRELRDWYRKVAILVMPSYYESFGLVAAEAMASGAALVATRVGLAASLQHEREALLINEPAAEPLRAAVATLIRNPSVRGTIARGGYARVQRLRWDLAVVALEEAYERWLVELRRSNPKAASGSAA